MDQKVVESRKSVPRGVIAFAILALSPLFLWGSFVVIIQLEYLPIRTEIARIANISRIKPLSVECNNGIDIGIVCSALYNELTYDDHSKMLIANGYIIDATHP